MNGKETRTWRLFCVVETGSVPLFDLLEALVVRPLQYLENGLRFRIGEEDHLVVGTLLGIIADNIGQNEVTGNTSVKSKYPHKYTLRPTTKAEEFDVQRTFDPSIQRSGKNLLKVLDETASLRTALELSIQENPNGAEAERLKKRTKNQIARTLYQKAGVVGEVSGEVLGSELVKDLLTTRPSDPPCKVG